MHEPSDDAALAQDLARAAGRLLIEARSGSALKGKALGVMGDGLAHEFLMRALAEHRPDDAVLSEEGAQDPARLKCSRVWIVDPLDGTREFSERRSDWAVHVALCIDGEASIGAVSQPDMNAVYASSEAKLTDIDGPLRIVVSRTRPPAEAERAAAALGAELVGMGSAGAKAMAVLRGEAHAYVHSGGQYEWDSAAPVAVARAAGLHACRLDGSPLIYNRADPYLPDLVICRPEFAGRLLAALNASGQDSSVS